MAPKRHVVEVVKPDLEIDEQLAWQEKGWVVQRVGWVLVGAVVVLAALGLFGEGVLSKRTPSAGGIEVEYDGFYRYEKEMQLKFRSSEAHIASISLPQTYLQHFRLVGIIPEPASNVSSAKEITYYFNGQNNAHVSIYLIPEQYGRLRGTMRVNQSSIALHHFIYP